MGNFNTQQQNMNLKKDAPLRDNNITLYLTRIWNGQLRRRNMTQSALKPDKLPAPRSGYSCFPCKYH